MRFGNVHSLTQNFTFIDAMCHTYGVKNPILDDRVNENDPIEGKSL